MSSLCSIRELCSGLNIFLRSALPNLNSLNEKVVNSIKRQLLALQGEKTVGEILSSLKFRYRTTPRVGVQIFVRRRGYLRSRYAVLIFKPNADPKEISLCRGILKLCICLSDRYF
ncbi:hypothetical protein ACTXT7_008410 [Hymenolepis weldensis]